MRLRPSFFTSFLVTFPHVAIAQCDSFAPFGTGLNPEVVALATYDGTLVAGGHFNTTNGAFPNWIAKWNGSAGVWEPVGAGVNDSVTALCVHNGDLIAGGWFTVAGSQTAYHIARWDGTGWHALGPGVSGPVYHLIVYNGDLIAGGDFLMAGALDVDHMARWDGVQWQSIGSPCSCFSSTVSAFAIFDNELYVGGGFTLSSDIAHWNGSRWQTLQTNGLLPFNVDVMASYDGNLVVGGANNAFPNPHIAMWNGSFWLPLGDGTSTSPSVLTVYNGDLIAGGNFTNAGGQAVNGMARWDGGQWHPLGGGVSGNGGNVGWAGALLVQDNQLFIGGDFDFAGDQPALNVAHWQDCDMCIADITNDRQVNLADLLAVINGWGPCPVVMPSCPEDIAPWGLTDGVVDWSDLAQVLSGFGPCWLPPPMHCPPDITFDGFISAGDLTAVLNAWGRCPPPPTTPPCPIDISHDGTMNAADLLMVINAWGPCP